LAAKHGLILVDPKLPGKAARPQEGKEIAAAPPASLPAPEKLPEEPDSN
jgi:hypothetical protein